MLREVRVAATLQSPRALKALTVDLFAGGALRFGDSDIVLSHRKCRALMAYLALADTARESRERLVGLLWSESDEERARASLRQCLHEIREAFAAAGFEGFRTGKLEVALDMAQVRVDLIEVIASAAAGSVHPILHTRERALDTLMADIEGVDPAFRAWVIAKRQALQARLTLALERALRDPEKPDAAREDAARALLTLDPTHEEAVRHVMLARAAGGDVGGALGAYRQLWNVLAEDYDVEPSRATQDLAVRIKLDQPETPGLAAPPPMDAAPGPRPGEDAKLIVAMEAFDASGAREENRYLVQGFRRDLIASLVRFREWLIRDAASGPATDQRDEYVIEASAFEIGQEVRLALVLRDRSSGLYLWSERVAVTPERWFEAQQNIVRRLATALNVHISMSRLGRIAHMAPAQPLAYDLWLRGQSEIFSWTRESLERNIERFKDIVARFPNFAPAYSTLAQMENGRCFMMPGTIRDAASIEAAFSYASEALRLDPVDARGHLALGWAYAMSGRHDRAAIHHGIALDLNENDTWTLMSVALSAAARGEHERAKHLADLSFDFSLTPSPSHWAYHSQIAFLRHDYEAAVAASVHARDAIPSAPGWWIAALGHLGRADDARREAATFVERAAARWSAPEPATPAAVTRWFLALFPFADPADRQHLAEGLARAGMALD